jgi:urea transport system ATP-binding protein
MNNPVFIQGEKILQESILYMDGVTVSFDGFRALDNLSILLEFGELRAIIGPNGAGKTTMMDVITGKVRPDNGDVLYHHKAINLATLDESGIAQLGIGRKFQKPTVFEEQSVLDNLYLALKANRGVWANLSFKPAAKQRELVQQVLEKTRLIDRKNDLAGRLSHGQKQWLEIGMLLVQDAQLLLVDEPAAGMTDAETEQTAKLLQEISGTKSVMVVEHDMDFVKALDCKVTVLHEGSVLAEGTHSEVQSNPTVIEVYLGR